MKFENGPPKKKITTVKKALQSAPSKAAKITGLLVIFLDKRIRGRLRRKQAGKIY